MALRAKTSTYAYKQAHDAPDIEFCTEDEGLMCPYCGMHQMHQKEARILWRDEDMDGVCHTSSRTKESKEIVKSTEIPGRRDFIEIDFDCEGCDEDLTMYIQQHKGYTFMGWVK